MDKYPDTIIVDLEGQFREVKSYSSIDHCMVITEAYGENKEYPFTIVVASNGMRLAMARTVKQAYWLRGEIYRRCPDVGTWLSGFTVGQKPDWTTAPQWAKDLKSFIKTGNFLIDSGV